jgi:uncharacterized protein (TIGR03067 family)
MKPHWLLALALPLCFVSPLLADDKADQKDLENGPWKLVALNKDGQDVAKDNLDKIEVLFTFQGEKLSIKTGNAAKENAYKIDSSKTPKELNLTLDKSEDKAIYELTKDTLKIAVGPKERPKDFKGGPNVVVFTLERVKK